MSTSSDAQDPSQPRQYPSRTSERFSIDLSLELEHQLESMESPSVNTTVGDSNSTKEKHESLDPHVLAHIIMQLRHSLTEITKERDELVKALSSAVSKEAELNDALQLMTEKASNLEEELAEAKKKVKEGEDAVALLRTKVEESRRGLMRLQTENRRQSGNSEAHRGTPILSFGNPPASKRASFTPLTGSLHAARANGHLRLPSDISISIQPEPTSASPRTSEFSLDVPVPHSRRATSPRTSEFPSLDVPVPARRASSPRTSEFPSLDIPVSTSRRSSGIFGRYSPPHFLEVPHSSDDSLSLELESLRKQLQSVKDELEDTKHRLSESNEAREASETCVKALRDFIAEDHVGVSETTNPAMQLPLPPSMATGEEVMETHKTTSSGGWSFGKLWKTEHGSKPSISCGTNIMSPTMTHQPLSTPTPAPLTKKFGGFFSSRSSMPGSLPPPLTGGDRTSHRGSLNSSDTSSITEPGSLGDISTTEGVAHVALAEVIVGSTDLEYATVQGSEAKDIHETVIID